MPAGMPAIWDNSHGHSLVFCLASDLCAPWQRHARRMRERYESPFHTKEFFLLRELLDMCMPLATPCRPGRLFNIQANPLLELLNIWSNTVSNGSQF